MEALAQLHECTILQFRFVDAIMGGGGGGGGKAYHINLMSNEPFII